MLNIQKTKIMPSDATTSWQIGGETVETEDDAIFLGFKISSSNEHPRLISLRMDWLDLLAVQGTPKSLLQHHSLKASTLQRLAFFTVQLSHPYMTTGKTIALTRWTFLDKVKPLFFNMNIIINNNQLSTITNNNNYSSRLLISFLPRTKRLLTS